MWRILNDPECVDVESTYEFVMEEGDPCAVNTIYISNRLNAGFGLPMILSGGECTRYPDDFLDDPLPATDEAGDVNGVAEEDDVCERGFTLVHEAGVNVENRTVSIDVSRDNCAQLCVPDMILGMLAGNEAPVLPGTCEDAGYPHFVAKVTTR